MANEISYTHATPGGRLARPFRPHLSRYKDVAEITPMSDYVTFGDAQEIINTLKENALLIGGVVLGAGVLWYIFSGSKPAPTAPVAQ